MPEPTPLRDVCASWYATYQIASSDGTDLYLITLCGGDGPFFCTCPSFKFFKGEPYDRTCKHIQTVLATACLWSEQWGMDPAGGPSQTCNDTVIIRPIAIEKRGIQEGKDCENCGGPLMVSRIMV